MQELLLAELKNARGETLKLIALMYKLIKMLIALFFITIITCSITIGIIVISNNHAETEKVRIYFETDYDYGTITQSTDVKVGDD